MSSWLLATKWWTMKPFKQNEVYPHSTICDGNQIYWLNDLTLLTVGLNLVNFVKDCTSQGSVSCDRVNDLSYILDISEQHLIKMHTFCVM